MITAQNGNIEKRWLISKKETSKYAKEKIWGHLKNKKVKDEKKRILNTHVNQK